LIVSAGTVTNRIARLERKGLVVRLRQPDDGRGVLVTMTESGRETFDAAFETLIELLAGVVGPIEGDQQQLAEILRRLLLPFGERAGLLPAPRELRSPPHRTPV
jgi:DNA-binding MarR family transcriptional regulator